MPRLACTIATLTLLAVSASPALAAGTSGGAEVPAMGGASYGTDPGASGLKAQPRLTTFALSSKTLSARLRFAFHGRAAVVRGVRVQLLSSGGQAVRTYRPGAVSQRRAHQLTIRSTGLKPGTYRVRITAARLQPSRTSPVLTVRVPKPRVAPEPAPQPTPTTTPAPAVGQHVFPVRGPYTFGGTGSRFGAGRKGHTHQGQDVAAAEGTPLVAPHAATVKARRYQAGGAGYYVVLDSTGEDRDYVFMHLKAGSTLVREGQSVATGQQIGQVGNTGSSEGPHLHFEIWTGGGWFTGGHPVDPLPYLQAWAAGR